MISLYTPVPQIATKSSDTERKNNRKSVRVIIYTVVKINSRPIGIGEREKWARIGHGSVSLTITRV